MSVHSKNIRQIQTFWGIDLNRLFLVRIPIETAVPLLGFATLFTTYGDIFVFNRFWLGPLYLLLGVISAWFVSSLFAVSLGAVVIFLKYLANHEVFAPYGQHSGDASLALRFLCMMAIILLIGMARRSLENEWRLARIDPLTGAMNRQAFFEAIKQSAPRKGPNVLAFADVDGLKCLNDQVGHESGDDALRDFADRVRAAIGKKDLFARIGGDEFVLFMQVKDEAAARAVPGTLNAALNCGTGTDTVTLKCSLGILLLPDGSKSIDSELNLADQLMYRAKRTGCGVSTAVVGKIDGQDVFSLPLDVPSVPRKGSVLRSIDRAAASDLSPSDDAVVRIRAA